MELRTGGVTDAWKRRAPRSHHVSLTFALPRVCCWPLVTLSTTTYGRVLQCPLLIMYTVIILFRYPMEYLLQNVGTSLVSTPSSLLFDLRKKHPFIQLSHYIIIYIQLYLFDCWYN